MIPRILVDLEPGAAIGKLLPELDLLGIAYGATRGGARGMLLPISATGRPPLYTADLFDRPGLPTLIIKCSDSELERAAGLGSAPERILVTGDRGSALQDFTGLNDFLGRSAGSNQEVAVLIEPEAAMLKSAARIGCAWVFFPTNKLYECKSVEEAEAELGRITSAALAANKLNLRIGAIGPAGRHLPSALAQIPYLEELVPTPDLWTHALRVGWESAVTDYLNLCR
ncbi:pyridoxine 5'-phosphate synthase [bacterium]|nr:pyridoxine 5'-phosphate synthase [bacterium]MBU1637443.1 pyridoxine 5'-phosphate synthase [bacterium]MBU1920564.1 pyridoxine 5'-phosphate synthase [bacterium]